MNNSATKYNVVSAETDKDNTDKVTNDNILLDVDFEEKNTVKNNQISYDEIQNQKYFDARNLKRSAGKLPLWGLGVAAVISGDFSGWNLGIGESGFGGMCVATLVMGIMYILMIFSISEMSAAMPHTGGAYSFARCAMGPWGGYITGLAETIEYVIACSAIAVFVSIYADAILYSLLKVSLPLIVWVFIIYIIFLILNCSGAVVSFRFSFVIAILSLLVLAIFSCSVIFSGKFKWDNLFDIEPKDQNENSYFLPYGIFSIFFALPYGMWFFLGIEELPLAAEETHTPSEDVPSASLWGMFTLLITAFLVLLLTPGVIGSKMIGELGDPILDAFIMIYNDNIAALLSLGCLIGTIASFNGILFAASRNIYSLSRAGYYPRIFSLTGRKTKAPYTAILLVCLVGFSLVALLPLIINMNEVELAGSLLNMAVFGAVLSYTLQMISYIILKGDGWQFLDRPYLSPVGNVGAIYSIIICLIIFIVLFLNENYFYPILSLTIFYIFGLLYFGIYARHHLLLSPEESFAEKMKLQAKRTTFIELNNNK